MELTRHDAWDSPTLKAYNDSLLENVYIKSEVPPEIKEQILLVEKLMIHTYYEYYFIDIALTQAIFILEKSLRLRYKEINSRDYTGVFKSLIKWFYDRYYFEERNFDVIDKLRDIRNGKVHDARADTGGIVYLKTVYTVFDLINDIYEDPQLRQSRFNEIDLLQSKLDSTCNEGAIISINNKRLIIYSTKIEFLNNKILVPVLNLRVRPIYDPATSYPDGKKILYHNDAFPPSLDIVVTGWQIDTNEITCKLLSDNSAVKISKIDDEINSIKFNTWWTEYTKFENFYLGMFESSLNQKYLKHLREFYK